jgi:hypothetical protein
MPLASGGIALMAFNYLHFAIPNAKDPMTVHDMLSANMTPLQSGLNWLLIALMLVLSVFTVGNILPYLAQWFKWRRDTAAYNKFMADSPPTLATGCIPFASLAMTSLVVLGPLTFFIPPLASNLQAVMLPGLILFGLLWAGLFRYTFMILKMWLVHPTDVEKLHFVWLLDAFSFGVVSLMGSSVAAQSGNAAIASIAAFGALLSVVFGLLLLMVKFSYLIFLQLRAGTLPGKNFVPAYFLVTPMSCLYGFSVYKLASYLHAHFAFDMQVGLFASLLIPYVISIGWGLFCIYLLWEYLTKDFRKIGFAAPQWSMI